MAKAPKNAIIRKIGSDVSAALDARKTMQRRVMATVEVAMMLRARLKAAMKRRRKPGTERVNRAGTVLQGRIMSSTSVSVALIKKEPELSGI